MTLRELGIGESCIIKVVGGEGALRQHFLDMGVIPGAEMTLIKFAPMGDPMELRVHGYELTLRLDDAEKIEIEKIAAVAELRDEKDLGTEDSKSGKDKSSSKDRGKSKVHHPGLGEGGI